MDFFQRAIAEDMINKARQHAEQIANAAGININPREPDAMQADAMALAYLLAQVIVNYAANLSSNERYAFDGLKYMIRFMTNTASLLFRERLRTTPKPDTLQ